MIPPYPKGKAVRWNLWILDSIRDELATLTAEGDMFPSQLVQELLWKALSDHRPHSEHQRRDHGKSQAQTAFAVR
jgi:hypothetical protein